MCNAPHSEYHGLATLFPMRRTVVAAAKIAAFLASIGVLLYLWFYSAPPNLAVLAVSLLSGTNVALAWNRFHARAQHAVPRRISKATEGYDTHTLVASEQDGEPMAGPDATWLGSPPCSPRGVRDDVILALSLLMNMAAVWLIYALIGLQSFVLRSPAACPVGLTLMTRLWLNATSTLRRPTVECYELNWPHFGQRELPFYDYAGLDPTATPQKRVTTSHSAAAGCTAPLGWNALASFHPDVTCVALRTLSRTTQWVVLDAHGYGNNGQAVPWQQWAGRTVSTCAPAHVVVACLSCPRQAFRAGTDIGVPPATFPRPSLYATDAADVRRRCHHASKAVVFRGSARKAMTGTRLALKQLNGTQIGELGPVSISFDKSNSAFESDMRVASFALSPRGDAWFSYRLSEVLASGVIPIIISDGWVLPFEELIPWETLALVVAEADVSTIPARLAGLSRADVCIRRLALFEHYQQYMATPEKWLVAIELILKQRRLEAAPYVPASLNW